MELSERVEEVPVVLVHETLVEVPEVYRQDRISGEFTHFMSSMSHFSHFGVSKCKFFQFWTDGGGLEWILEACCLGYWAALSLVCEITSKAQGVA